MVIRNFQLQDTEQVIALWKRAKVFYLPWDTPQNLQLKHSKEPNLFLVAEEKGKIVGAVMGQYDGWGAYIHHLVAIDNYKSLSDFLLQEIEQRLKKQGAKNIFIFTYPQSTESKLMPKHNFKLWGLSEGWEKNL